MKRKLSMIILTLTLALCSILGLTACGGNNDNGETPSHTHEYTILKHNATEHWYECSCGDKNGIEQHNIQGEFISNNDGTKSQKCICGYGGINIVDEAVLVVENGIIIGLTEFGRTLTNIVIPYGIIGIGDRAFSGYDENGDYYKSPKLTSIEIPNSVNSIGSFAFAHCYQLETLILPNSVTSIGSSAFHACTSLESLYLPDSIKNMGSVLFAYCDLLTLYCESENQPFSWGEGNHWNNFGNSVVWDCSINDIPENKYKYTIIEGIRYALKDGVASVAFMEYSLTSVIIPENITFNNETYSVTSISDRSFALSPIMNIMIPQSVKNIGSEAFSLCNSLTSITIPSSVISIGAYAFAQSEFIANIVFEDALGWYVTDNYEDWKNKTGGIKVDLSNPLNNATYIKDNYDYYLYKK